MQRFNIQSAKPILTPLTTPFKLSLEQSTGGQAGIEAMLKIPYSSVIGSLMFAMVGTRPHSTYSVNLINKFMSNLGKKHWYRVKYIIRYLRGTSNFGLVYKRNIGAEIVKGYRDVDFIGDLYKMRPLIGYAFSQFGNIVKWKCDLQFIIALSTNEAKYTTCIEEVKEVVWV